MGTALIPLATGLAVLCAVIAVWSLLSDLFLRDRSRVAERMDDEFRNNLRNRVKKTSLFKDLGKMASAAAFDAPKKRKLSFRERTELFIERSGVPKMTFEKLMAMTGGAAVAGAMAGLIGAGPVGGAVAAAICAMLPYLYIRHQLNQRLEKLRSQLPDAFDLMARAMRAGQTMAQSMASVAEELVGPIAYEFSVCSEQQNLGLPVDESLRDLAHRTGLMEVNIFTVAVIVQRQVGGNLAEMLEKLGHLIRERYRVRGLIQTLTAEGRMQAVIMMALPPLLLVVMLFLNPSYTMQLFDYPMMLVAIVAGDVIGGLWIRKIVNFDF